MTAKVGLSIICAIVIAMMTLTGWLAQRNAGPVPPDDREEVLFWHFWGGEDRTVVEHLVDRFNQSQDKYWVRAVAMPGNNLDTKIFLSITGGDPPDLVNQDDPIVGDWAARGAILAFEDFAPRDELSELRNDLFYSARALGTFEDRTFAICNGLDIRALYYNKTTLDQFGLEPPETIADLDKIARTIAPPESAGARKQFGYLPDARRLWAWGYVFGGSFYDASSQKVTCDSNEVLSAVEWMTQYSRWYGADTINAFRQGDQSLPGKRFPLLPVSDQEMTGRYSIVMDGQWRTRDIDRFVQQRQLNGLATPEFGVCPLPIPPNGRTNAGWVNGNFFVVPRGAKSKRGAWEFIKFWIGKNNPELAAEFCVEGGWIPTTQSVRESNVFKEFLDTHPLFEPFVELASSENQFPIPVVPGAPFFKRTIEQAASQSMENPEMAKQVMEKARDSIQEHLNRTRSHPVKD